MLRIVFFGTPEFAVPSLDVLIGSRHRVIGLVTQPDRPRGRGQKVTAGPVKARAEQAGIPVIQPDKMKDEAFVEQFAEWAPDLGVVAAYGKLLPESLLARPRLGMINVHASLLPKYRGAAPIQRAVMAGESETGVTIMRVVKALDAGAMILKGVTPIGPADTSVDVERALAALGGGLLLQVVDALSNGTAVETPQDDEASTYANRILKTDGVIEWDRTAFELHNQVRGLHPWPHAYTYLDGVRQVIHETRPYAAVDEVMALLAGDQQVLLGEQIAAGRRPGTVLIAGKGRLLVSAGGGSILEILRVQEEGRRVLSAREYLAGRAWPVGALLASGDPV
jgi:methionyl-tRNA formyltransferase